MPAFRIILIRVLCVLCLFFGTIAISRYLTRPPKYHPKYQTVAHRFLDLEGRYASVTDEEYELLDNVICEVKARTHFDPADTNPVTREKRLREIFDTIDAVLIENNFIFPPGEYTTTLGESLDDSYLNAKNLELALGKSHNARRAAHMREHADEAFHLMACEPSAFFYMGVAEALGFEMKPVMLPDHIFVRAQIDAKHSINWDPNRGRVISDAEYAHDWDVQPWEIREKIFMHSLSGDEADGLMYSAIGFRLADEQTNRGYLAAIECDRKAVQLNPQDYGADDGLAVWLLFKSSPDAKAQAEAMECARRGLELRPNDAAAHTTQAYVFATAGQTSAAVAELNKAIELEPKDTDAAEMLPAIQSGSTMYAAFRSQTPFEFWIRYEHGTWHILGVIALAGVAGIIFVSGRRRRAEQAAAVGDR